MKSKIAPVRNFVTKAKKLMREVDNELTKRSQFFDAKSENWAYTNAGEKFETDTEHLKELREFLDEFIG